MVSPGTSSRAVVLASGGLDSTVAAALAREAGHELFWLTIAYGQRHAIEVERARQMADAMRAAKHTVLSVDLRALGGSALTAELAVPKNRQKTERSQGIPVTYVPGRNLIFLMSAAALGYRRGISNLVGGMCETDFSGYPDCRDETIQATARALTLGLARKTIVHTPLMWMDKAATWKLAQELGGKPLVDLIVRETVTCYAGSATEHEWGRGCGTCPACNLRRKGYEKYRAA